MTHLQVILLTFFFGINLNPTSAHKNIWAILLAGYDDYEYTYSFEAAVCNMYNRLRKQGVLPEHIITMSPESAAFNRANRLPGLVTFGQTKTYLTEEDNIYDNVVIDYKIKNLLSDQFYDILSGNEVKLNGTGSGKVLKSGPNDYVYMYIVTVGNYGFITLNNYEILWAEEFVPFLENMKEDKRFKKMFITLESENAGSMFDDYLDTDKSILVHALGGRYSELYVCHYNELLRAFTSTCSTFLHSLKIDQIMASTNNEFKNIFDLIADTSYEAKPPLAVPNLYGQLNIGNARISAFMGVSSSKNGSSLYTSRTVTKSETERELIKNGIREGKSMNRLLQEDKRTSEAEKIKLKNILTEIVSQSTTNVQLSNKILEEPIQYFPTGKYKCYKTVFNVVRSECFTTKNYHILLTKASTLAKLCATNVPEDKIIAVTKKICEK